MKDLTSTSVNEKGITYAAVKTTVKGETNDCTVRALAAATGSAYAEAHEYAKKNWKREDKKGVSTLSQINDFLKNSPLGATFEPIGDKEYKTKIGGEEITMRQPKTYYNNGGEIVERTMTTKTLLERYPEGTFYVLVRKHAFAVKDGVVIGNVEDAQALRKRLRYVFKVK
jgi:hypothetical protein